MGRRGSRRSSILSTPCNGFYSGRSISSIIPPQLSTPCNGFSGLRMVDVKWESAFVFQLHVMDS